MSTDQTLFFGNDVGMGSNKLAGPAGVVALLSQAATARTDNGVADTLGLRRERRQQAPLRLALPTGNTYYVGERAHDYGRPLDALDYERMLGVPETRAILYGAFTRYIQQHGDLGAGVTLIVGVPLGAITGPEGETNKAAIEKWLTGKHTWQADGQAYHLDIMQARVAAQATGALFDYLLDDAGQFIPERKAAFRKEIGVISVGFNTVELQVIRNRERIPNLTGSDTKGVRRLLELVENSRFYSPGQLDALLRAGELDVAPYLDDWMAEIRAVVERVWGTAWRRFERVLIVGGGALVLKERLALRFNGKGFTPTDPVQSIARGLRKIALNQFGGPEAEAVLPAPETPPAPARKAPAAKKRKAQKG